MHVLLKTVQLDLMDLLIEDYRPRILLCHTIFRSVAAPFNPYQFLCCNVRWLAGSWMLELEQF